MSAPLNNDTLATTYTIKPSDGNYLGGQSNINAVNTSPNGEPTSSPSGPLWFYWQPKTADQGLARLFGIAAATGTGFDSYIRIYTGPKPTAGVFPTFNLLTQVGFDDDGSVQPTVGQDGYTLPASYPSNNASVRITIDTTKVYYIAAGGFSTNRNGNFAVDFPVAGGGDLGNPTVLGIATVSGYMSGGKTPLGAIGAQPQLTTFGKTSVSAYLQRLLVPGKSAKTLGNESIIVASLETHFPRGDSLGSATGAVTGPW